MKHKVVHESGDGELYYREHDGSYTLIPGGQGGMEAHALGGAYHTASTLAAVNAIISDADLVSTADAAAAIQDHADDTTGVHGVGASTVASVGDISTHASGPHPTTDQAAALAGTTGSPGDSNRYVTNADARNSDARTPTAHGSTAHTGTIGTWSQIDRSVSSLGDLTTRSAADLSSGTLDGDRLPAVSATKRGGTPATGAPSGRFLRDDGTWVSPGGGGGGDTVVRLTADRQTTSVPLVDCTGLSFTPEAGATYLVDFDLYYTLSTASYGATFSVNGPASPGAVALQLVGCTAAGTIAGRVVNAYNAGTNLGAGIAGVNYANLKGVFVNGVNTSPALILRMASENASGTLTVRTGSSLKYRKIS